MTPELQKVIEAAREATCDTHNIPACVELGKALYAYDKARGAICPVCDGAGSLPDGDSHPGEGPMCTGPCGGTGLVDLDCDFDHPHPSHPCGRHVPEASTCTCDKEYPCPACLARANDVLDAQRARHVGDDPKPEYIAVPALENARQKIQASADGGQVAVLTSAECREVGRRLTR